MLEDVNPYIGIYCTARERLQITPAAIDTTIPRILFNPQLQLVIEQGVDRRRHNLPTAAEVAVIMIGDESDQLSN